MRIIKLTSWKTRVSTRTKILIKTRNLKNLLSNNYDTYRRAETCLRAIIQFEIIIIIQIVLTNNKRIRVGKILKNGMKLVQFYSKFINIVR